MDEEPRIIATSPATADICDRLELDLVGVCSAPYPLYRNGMRKWNR